MHVVLSAIIVLLMIILLKSWLACHTNQNCDSMRRRHGDMAEWSKVPNFQSRIPLERPNKKAKIDLTLTDYRSWQCSNFIIGHLVFVFEDCKLAHWQCSYPL
jgi:hypothetical protein